jgi:hypothetical protein
MTAALASLAARRLALFAVALFALSLATALCAAHARSLTRARSLDERSLRSAASAVGPELALYAGARWLRHPTRSEPWAYGHDGPGLADPDPAGAFASAPRAVLAHRSVVTHAALVRHGVRE